MKTAGILGGMGPIATLDFLFKIVKNTDAKQDSEHVHMLVDNNTEIPDRSAYIQGSGENPEKFIIDSALKLQEMGSDFIVMPCNTAHYFYDNVKKALKIPVINMIDETAKNLIGETKVGLLATKGTYFSNVYEKVFTNYNIELVTPPMKFQDVIMEIIYKVKGGEIEFDKDKIDLIIEYFNNLGVKKLILGCTELPIVFKNVRVEGELVDPTKILAISVIKRAGKKVLSNL